MLNKSERTSVVIHSGKSKTQERIYSDLEKFKNENPESKRVMMIMSHELYYPNLTRAIMNEIIAVAKNKYQIELTYSVMTNIKLDKDYLKFENMVKWGEIYE